MMKTLSYIALVIALVCVVLALVTRIFFDEKLLFRPLTYISGASVAFLGSIAFAIQHLITMKSK